MLADLGEDQKELEEIVGKNNHDTKMSKAFRT